MPLSEILDTGVTATLIVYAASGLLLGMSRGFSRQTVKLMTVLGAFLLSLALFTRIYPFMVLAFEERTLLEVAQIFGLSFDETVTSYLEVIEGEDAAYILAIPLTVVIIPMFFVVCFNLIKEILAIPHVVVCGALGYTKQANTPFTRLLGGIVGLAQGVFIAAISLMPVAGMIEIAEEAVTIAENEHPGFKNTELISDFYHTNVEQVANNKVLEVVDEHLGFIYDRFTTIDVEGEEIRVVTAVDDFVELFVYYGELGDGEKFDYMTLTEKDKQIIDEMIASFGDDKLMTVLVADFFKALGTASETGAFVLGIDEPLKTLMNTLLFTFATTDETNVEGDLSMYAEVCYFLACEGVFTAEDTTTIFMSFLNIDENGESTFKRLCDIFETNPRFAHISPTLSELAMRMLLENSGIDQDAQETLTEVKDTVNNVLSIDKESFETAEEYKEAVNNEVSETLANNGIDLEPDQIDQITDYIIQQKEESGKTEFTDADMADFMAKYYDIYAKGQNNGGNTEGGEEGGEEGGDTEGGDDDETEGGGEIVLPPDIELPPGFEIPPGFEWPLS